MIRSAARTPPQWAVRAARWCPSSPIPAPSPVLPRSRDRRRGRSSAWRRGCAGSRTRRRRRARSSWPRPAAQSEGQWLVSSTISERDHPDAGIAIRRALPFKPGAANGAPGRCSNHDGHGGNVRETRLVGDFVAGGAAINENTTALVAIPAVRLERTRNRLDGVEPLRGSIPVSGAKVESVVRSAIETNPKRSTEAQHSSERHQQLFLQSDRLSRAAEQHAGSADARRRYVQRKPRDAE